jgi:hypothetical protein
MGRPLNKRYFGTVTDEVGSEASENLTAIVKVTGEAVSETGIILSQRSETKFKVNDANDGTGTDGICVLVNKDVPADGEMVLKGYIAGTGDGVNIRKMHNRTCIDFDDNRYTWEIQDDSTSNVLVLTAI